MTKITDALCAEKLGANAIGLIFAPSPRRVDVDKAIKISKNLNKAQKVGVFVNSNIAVVQEIRYLCRLDVIQLHGDETPNYCRLLGGTIIKALRLQDDSILQRFQEYSNIWRILLDAYVPGKMGGTGQQIDKKMLAKIDDFSNIIIAGGVNPDNIKELTTEFKPFGIDVSSGVEKIPGVKDRQKLVNLFNSLR